MAGASFETTSIKIDTDKYRFTTAVSKVVFSGYLTIYQTEEDKIEKKSLSRNLEKGTKLKAGNFEKSQHFTQPPAHFTEASLVKTLEELGIGRPSTYAPTISTIINRHYVAKEQKNLYITELGEKILCQYRGCKFYSIYGRSVRSCRRWVGCMENGRA